MEINNNFNQRQDTTKLSEFSPTKSYYSVLRSSGTGICMATVKSLAHYMVSWCLPYGCFRHRSDLLMNKSSLSDEQKKLAYQDLAKSTPTVKNDFAYNGFMHKDAIMIAGHMDHGRTGLLKNIAHAYDEEFNMPNAKKGANSAYPVQIERYEEKRQFYELAGFGNPSNSSKTVINHSQFADWPIKINNAGKVVFCMKLFNRVDQSTVDDITAIVRNLPPDENNKPDISRLHLVFTNADQYQTHYNNLDSGEPIQQRLNHIKIDMQTHKQNMLEAINNILIEKFDVSIDENNCSMVSNCMPSGCTLMDTENNTENFEDIENSALDRMKMMDSVDDLLAKIG